MPIPKFRISCEPITDCERHLVSFVFDSMRCIGTEFEHQYTDVYTLKTHGWTLKDILECEHQLKEIIKYLSQYRKDNKK